MIHRLKLITLGLYLSGTWGVMAALGPTRAETVTGQGAVQGTGTVEGQLGARGQGQAQGTGVVLYRDAQGRPRVKRGSGTVSGQGMAIGRGTVTGSGIAVGQGSARGRGGYRSR